MGDLGEMEVVVVTTASPSASLAELLIWVGEAGARGSPTFRNMPQDCFGVCEKKGRPSQGVVVQTGLIKLGCSIVRVNLSGIIRVRSQ